MNPLEDLQAEFAADVELAKAAPLTHVADEVARALKMAVDHNKTCKDCVRPDKATRDFLDQVAGTLGHYTSPNIAGAHRAFSTAVAELEGLSDRAADDLKRVDAARKVRERAFLLGAMIAVQGNMLQGLIKTQMRKSGGEAARGMSLLAGFAKELAAEHARVGALYSAAGGVAPTKSRNAKNVRIN